MFKKIILINKLKINNDLMNIDKRYSIYTKKCLEYIKKNNLDIICDNCNGTGWILKKDYIVCKRCKGIGKYNK